MSVVAAQNSHITNNISMTTGKRLKSKEKFPNDNSERPFFCEACGRGFYRLEHKKRHLKIHTGEKPYKCKHANCVKSFSRSDELRRHSKIHLNNDNKESATGLKSETNVTKRVYKKKIGKQSIGAFPMPLTPVSSMTDIKGSYSNTSLKLNNMENAVSTLASLKQSTVLPSSNRSQLNLPFQLRSNTAAFRLSDSESNSNYNSSDNENITTTPQTPPLTEFSLPASSKITVNILTPSETIKVTLPPLSCILRGIEIFEKNK